MSSPKIARNRIQGVISTEMIFSLRETIFIIMSYLVGLSIILLLIGYVLYKILGVQQQTFSIESLFLVSQLAYIVCFVICINKMLKTKNKTWRDLGFRRASPARTLKYVSGFYILMLLLLLGLAIAISLLPIAEPANSKSAEVFDKRLILLPISILIAPLLEEVVFRSMLFPALLHKMRPHFAIIISGVIFALCHFDPSIMVTILPLGIYSAWMYYRLGSIWPSILLHMSWNLFVNVVK